MAYVFCTSNIGLEDVVTMEFETRMQMAGLQPCFAQVSPFGYGGQLLLAAPVSIAALLSVVRRMRSIHHIYVPQAYTTFLPDVTLADIAEFVAQIQIPEMYRAANFRVTSERYGRHTFSSMDVQREAGTVLQARYGTAVDLENFALNVRVDVWEHHCLLSLQQTRQSLAMRFRKVYQSRAALMPNVAYAMLHLAELPLQTATLLDPFCGSGTILLEAARVCPEWTLWGSDRRGDVVAGARDNARALGLADRILFQRLNARNLGHGYPVASVDAIITNPPYGLRLGGEMDFDQFYYDFLTAAHMVLKPGGRLVLLVWKRGPFNRIVRRMNGFRLRHVRMIATGQVHPGLFILDRL